MKEDVFYQTIRRSLFNGKLNQTQVNGLAGIFVAFDEVGDRDMDTLAYSMATAYHETGARLEPVREGFAKTDAGARAAVAKLAKKRGPKSNPAKYGLSVGPYGHAYYGRGYPQLTWMENYEACSEDAGVDLVQFPDAMLDPRISARVLIRGIITGRWNGKGIGFDAYEGSDDFLDAQEAAKARQLVNGSDKAVLIARYHRKFYEALSLAAWTPIVVTKVTASSQTTLGPSESTARSLAQIVKAAILGKS